MKPTVLIEDAFLEDHSTLYRALLDSVEWNHAMAARKTASFGIPYNYSRMTYPAAPMHPELVPVVDKLQKRLGITFNNCLLNLYETGDNTMGFHSDDTANLQPGTGVAIVSLGHSRHITYRHKEQRDLQCSFALRPGSLLYMDSTVQDNWMHGIKKQKNAGTRISLTWRAFKSDLDELKNE